MYGIYKAPLHFLDQDPFSAPTLGDTYKRVLKEHSLNRRNRIIENDTFEDSSSVYERFFLDCTSEVRMIARGIKKEIFDRQNVIAAAHKFLSRDGVSIVIDIPFADGDDKKTLYSSEFLRAITDMASGTKKLKINRYKQIQGKAFLGDLPSASFGDARMYRTRSLQKSGDYSTSANADVNFNDPEMVSTLTRKLNDALSKEELIA